jgi:demethylmenaquinone methyltransferase/2-methoxy-6-polyprenyl-1,4-benzoquinol methylase
VTGDKILNDQVAYYRARAAEYDEWHLRQGRYDRGEAHRRQWHSELDWIRTRIDQAGPLGDCLELACGTGLWTPQLADCATRVTALDAVFETIEINRDKVGTTPVNYVVADLFEWWPDRVYDTVFFAFWLSHVPAERFDRFWEMVRAALKPDGRVLIVDSLPTQESTAIDHAPIDDTGVMERKLNDGRTFVIVKNFHRPRKLLRRLQGLGWTGAVEPTGEFFYFGKLTA